MVSTYRLKKDYTLSEIRKELPIENRMCWYFISEIVILNVTITIDEYNTITKIYARNAQDLQYFKQLFLIFYEKVS